MCLAAVTGQIKGSSNKSTPETNEALGVALLKID